MMHKPIKCECGKEIWIPTWMDEDYNKNEYPCVLYGNEVDDGAICDPDVGKFVCKDCYKKLILEVYSEEDDSKKYYW